MDQIKKYMMFILSFFMLFALLPIIGSQAINASERIEFETVSFTITSGTTITLTDDQYQALLDAYNGDAYGLSLKINDTTYQLIDNYEIVDPEHEWTIVTAPAPITRYFRDTSTSRNIFYFYILSGNKFTVLSSGQSFNYLDQTVNITHPSEWTISFDIVIETNVKTLSALIPILAVLITIGSIAIYFKFR